MDDARSRAGITRPGAIIIALCVGVFLMLLFPYLLGSREMSRRQTCLRNLSRIGIALTQYSDLYQTFPYGTVQQRGLAPQQRLSWYPEIWTFIDDNAAQPIVRTDQPWDGPDNLLATAYIGAAEPPENATDSPVLVCPSFDVKRSTDEPGPTSYVGVAGVGNDAAELASSDARSGIWGYARQTRLKRGPQKIGPRLLLAETSTGIGPWTAGGPSTVRGLDTDRSQALGRDGSFGGNHPHGATVLLSSFAFQFLNDKIDDTVLAQIITIRQENGPQDAIRQDNGPQDNGPQENGPAGDDKQP